MHIKNIHCMIEKLSEVAKCEIDKGIEMVDTKEMGEVVDIIKDLAEAEYYAKISKAMDESEYGEDYDYMGAYDDMRKGYRGQPRDSRGRYMSRRGGRRGYEEPMYHMPLDVYKDYSAEELRDMDRHTMGRMYYTDNANGGSMATRMQGGMNGERDNREGRSGMSRRGYMEAKEMGKEKGEKMKELEKYMKELSEDVTEMIGDASPEEKAMLKSKMQTLLQKIQ
jgi:hypothetical protein